MNLLVLRCADVARVREFYECMGLRFSEHQHGNGPVHLGALDGNRLLIELYPASEKNPVDRCGLGFGAVDLQQVIATLMGKQFEPVAVEERAWGTTFIVRDPDGRRVEVKYESSNRA
jgi:catechol 2,3-dioxygenase-like lactoylglutathione lyase family enzyme